MGKVNKRNCFFPHRFCCITALTWEFKKASQRNGAIPSTSYSISFKNSPYDFPLNSVNSILLVLDWAEIITEQSFLGYQWLILPFGLVELMWCIFLMSKGFSFEI